MSVLAAYTFWDAIWTMFVFFAWVLWIWLLIMLLTDVFRRHDIGGFSKALWVLFMIFLPLIGVISYLIVNGHGMAERQARDQVQAREQADSYIRSVASSTDPAAQIARGKELLDSGAITASEFDALKQKALAGG